MPKKNNLKTISFFSGALGLDLGLEQAGFKILALNEFDPIACQTIRLNRPKIPLYDFDIRKLTAANLMRDLKIKRRELFLVCGGPPCQAFSTAGKRLGLNDERGNVFLYYIELIRALEPKYILIENVRGLLSAPLVHRPHDQRGSGYPPLSEEELPGGALKHIINLLKECGYSISFNLYNTANFGVPQIRERVILLGSRSGEQISDLVPTHDEKERYGLPKWLTFREAIEGLNPSDEYLKFSPRSQRFFKMLKTGENWKCLPSDLQEEAMGKSFQAGGGKTGFFRRLAWDKPTPTLVTRPNMPATFLAHPTEDRTLSVQEYARIQMFPDEWRFAGKIIDKYKQIGNAVPVGFGKAIGSHLIAFDRGLLKQDTRGLVPLSRYRNTDHVNWQGSVSKT